MHAPHTSIALVSPGAAPRRTLHYPAFKAGHRESLDWQTTMRVGVSLADRRPREVKLPIVKHRLALLVKQPGPRGERQVEFRFTDVEVATRDGVLARVEKQIQRRAAALGQVRGRAVLSPHGVMLAYKVKLGDQVGGRGRLVLRAILRTLQELVAPFPAKPVGVGAVWKVVTKVKVGGFLLEQVATCTLERLRAKRGRLKISLVQRMPKKNKGALSAGALTVELAKLEVTGSADVQFDLARLLPAYSGKFDFFMTTSSMVKGKKRRVSVSRHYQMEIKPR